MYTQFPTVLKVAGMLGVYCGSSDCAELLVDYAGNPASLPFYERSLATLSEEQLVELVATGEAPVGQAVNSWLESAALLANGFALTSKEQCSWVEQWRVEHAELHASPRPEYPAMRARAIADGLGQYLPD